jgi:uncharacterized protein YneF (UPF0154 family)
MKQLILLMLLFASLSALAQKEVEVPYTLEDRDRIIRVETKTEVLEAKMEALEAKMEALETKMDIKFEAVNSRIDYLFWMMGILTALMIFILGFIIWDRRTAMNPLRENQDKQKIEIGKIKAILKEMGENDQKIAEILKRASIL